MPTIRYMRQWWCIAKCEICCVVRVSSLSCWDWIDWACGYFLASTRCDFPSRWRICVAYFNTFGRCVMNINVEFLFSWTMRWSTISSVSLSNEDVASSKIIMLPSESKARAMAMRWACPSESPPPDSLHGVSRPLGSSNTKSAEAVWSAFRSSSTSL